MRAAAGTLRTVQDARTARSLPARLGPGGDHDAYAQLAQLAREKHRLRGERELWQRKLDRITRRLTEIDTQMQRLERHTHQPTPPPHPHWREIEFPY